MAKFLALDGTTGTYASTPHSEAVDITGDLTLVAKVAPEVWGAGAGTRTIMAKAITTANRSWLFRQESNGSIRLWVSNSDGSVAYGFAGPLIEATDGDDLWLAVSLKIDNGNDLSEAQYYMSRDGAVWEGLGAWQGALLDSLRSVDVSLDVGAYAGGSVQFNGRVYRAQLWEGAGFDLNSGPTGTLAADFNAEDAPDDAVGGDSFESALTGETWTLHGNASIGGVRTVISDDMVLQPTLPRPSVCLTGMARREVRLQAVWRQCR